MPGKFFNNYKKLREINVFNSLKNIFFYRIGEWETGKATVSYQVINSTLPPTITPFEYTSTFFEILTNTISTCDNEKMKMLPPPAMVQKKSKDLEKSRYEIFTS